jgi:hypothetical protein
MRPPAKTTGDGDVHCVWLKCRSWVRWVELR